MSHLKTALFAGAALTLAGAAAAQDATGGKPDFTGSWTNYRAGNVAGAFTGTGDQMQLTEFGQRAADDFNSLIEGTDHGAGNSCVGSGMPASMLGSGGYPMEIIQRPEQVFVLYEAHAEIRRLYIGDEAQDASMFFPERNGYSTARWEGDRLIVETTNLKTQVDTRYPHSDQAHIVEEYYLDGETEDGARILVAEMTMTDPVFLEEPFTTTKRWQEMEDYHVLTYECSEPKWLDEMAGLYEEAGLEMVQE